MPDARGSQCEFPALNQGGIPGDWPEEVRFADVVVVQPILRPRLKCVGVEGPAAQWNGEAKLTLFIALSVQWSECETLAVRQFRQGSGAGYDGRSLVKVPIEGAKHPVESRDFYGHAKTRIRRILHHVCREVRLAKADD